ncbi:MAG: hypothetical protein HQL17_02975 [Candidatus Omnitrophica bacterium]|nr:hypothetical protein [Candidatus Omnitrophota bacterium]
MIKGLLAAVGVVFVGVVAYKIIEKKNPAMLKGIKKSIDDAGSQMSAVIDDAKESFYEGYAQG